MRILLNKRCDGVLTSERSLLSSFEVAVSGTLGLN